jgi:sulfopyruvate decarboxylase subunit alpha
MVLEHLKRAGIDLVASLPDQWLGKLIAQCEADPAITHIKLAREDDGIGLCEAALICQNSGVLASVNALGGIAFHHQIPLLIIAAHRGTLEDNHYYQMYKGRICEPVLRAMGLPHYVVEGPDELSKIEDGVRHAYLNRLPVVLLLRKKAFQ